MKRHEAIAALKQIARDRNDPYLADQIETWIQRFVIQFQQHTSTDKQTLTFVKDPIDYMDHIKKKGLIELGAGAANLTAETFESVNKDTDTHEITFRLLALRPNPTEEGGPGRAT